MKYLLMLVTALALGACTLPSGAGDSTTEQATDDRPCELVLKLRAAPKKGLRKLGSAGDYGESSKTRADARIKRVDYENLTDIVVVIEGPGQDRPADADRSANSRGLEITADGFSSGLVSLTLLRARDLTAGDSQLDREAELTLTNRTPGPLNVFSSADSASLVDVYLEPGESRTLALRHEGLIDLFCEEDETMQCRVVVSQSAFVRRGRAGQDLKMFLPPGEFTVTVHAPRLPAWRGRVVMAGGLKTETTVVLGVNDLPKARK